MASMLSLCLKLVCFSFIVLFNHFFQCIIEVEYDAKQEEDDRFRAKMKEIDRIEQLHHEKDEQDSAKPTDDTFGDRMKFQIIKNLQLSIHNIHIVYEDRTTKPNHPFSFGITLNSMTFQVETIFH